LRIYFAVRLGPRTPDETETETETEIEIEFETGAVDRG
jgi:hypothetical protein